VGELDFLIADKEKAVIDSLDLPDNAGGMIKVAKAFYNASDKIDLNKLFKYATVMEKNWTKDLKILLGSPVPYEVAAGLVVERLNIIQ
jgi:predicted transcriptional regulator of viral defense system